MDGSDDVSRGGKGVNIISPATQAAQMRHFRRLAILEVTASEGKANEGGEEKPMLR